MATAAALLIAVDTLQAEEAATGSAPNGPNDENKIESKVDDVETGRNSLPGQPSSSSASSPSSAGSSSPSKPVPLSSAEPAGLSSVDAALSPKSAPRPSSSSSPNTAGAPAAGERKRGRWGCPRLSLLDRVRVFAIVSTFLTWTSGLVGIISFSIEADHLNPICPQPWATWQIVHGAYLLLTGGILIVWVVLAHKPRISTGFAMCSLCVLLPFDFAWLVVGTHFLHEDRHCLDIRTKVSFEDWQTFYVWGSVSMTYQWLLFGLFLVSTVYLLRSVYRKRRGLSIS